MNASLSRVGTGSVVGGVSVFGLKNLRFLSWITDAVNNHRALVGVGTSALQFGASPRPRCGSRGVDGSTRPFASWPRPRSFSCGSCWRARCPTPNTCCGCCRDWCCSRRYGPWVPGKRPSSVPPPRCTTALLGPLRSSYPPRLRSVYRTSPRCRDRSCCGKTSTLRRGRRRDTEASSCLRASHLGFARRSCGGGAALSRADVADNETAPWFPSTATANVAGRKSAALDVRCPHAHVGGRVPELSASPSRFAAPDRYPRSDRYQRQRAGRRGSRTDHLRIVAVPVTDTRPKNIAVYMDDAYPVRGTDQRTAKGIFDHLDAELKLQRYPGHAALIDAKGFAKALRDVRSAPRTIIVAMTGMFPAAVLSTTTDLVSRWVAAGGTLVWGGTPIGAWSAPPVRTRGADRVTSVSGPRASNNCSAPDSSELRPT